MGHLNRMELLPTGAPSRVIDLADRPRIEREPWTEWALRRRHEMLDHAFGLPGGGSRLQGILPTHLSKG